MTRVSLLARLFRHHRLLQVLQARLFLRVRQALQVLPVPARARAQVQDH